MTKGLNRKFMNMALAAVRKKAFFLNVQDQVPTWPLPSSIQLPAAFVFALPSPMDALTNVEKRRQLNFGVVGFVRAEDHLELVKMDCGDEIEEALEDLLKDQSFIQLAVRVMVARFDPGPLALIDIGLQPGIFPPFGAVRFDGTIEYDYDVS